MILSTSNISIGFLDEHLIHNANIMINTRDKVALVGANGSGKTTLLRILSGELCPDTGIVTIAKDTSLGFLHQINNIDSNLTIQEELYTVIQPILDIESELHKVQEAITRSSGQELKKLYEYYHNLNHSYEKLDGYMARSKVSGILKGLGFKENDFNKTLNTLSGGQKTRVFLGKLLLSEPELILLDEPTNHLDLSSIEWLENYLLTYKGSIIIVSHDRYFLDKIVNKVIDIDMGELRTYQGNYTDFAKKKEDIRSATLKAYLNQEAEIKHQEKVIEKLRSFNREKSIKRAESRQKMLDKMERLSKPIESHNDMKLLFSQTVSSGKDVLHVDNISKAFADNRLFSNISFDIKRGEHVAIIGDNGTGKTTILKILTGLIEPDNGYIQLGSNVLTAYYDQEHQILDSDKSLFDELQDAYPDMTNTEVRNTLAAFLFTGDDVFKKIHSLSGGERGRISLAKLMLSRANLLLLDEPTNHLDSESKEILEYALNNFEGTVIYVSHDRYFINRTATRILDLRYKHLFNYIGNYDYYLEKREYVEAVSMEAKIDSDSAENKSSKQAWLNSKEEQARQKKLKNSLKNCEENIHKLEAELELIHRDFLNPSYQSDADMLMELNDRKESLESELSILYDKWEILATEE